MKIKRVKNILKVSLLLSASIMLNSCNPIESISKVFSNSDNADNNKEPSNGNIENQPGKTKPDKQVNNPENKKPQGGKSGENNYNPNNTHNNENDGNSKSDNNNAISPSKPTPPSNNSGDKNNDQKTDNGNVENPSNPKPPKDEYIVEIPDEESNLTINNQWMLSENELSLLKEAWNWNQTINQPIKSKAYEYELAKSINATNKKLKFHYDKNLLKDSSTEKQLRPKFEEVFKTKYNQIENETAQLNNKQLSIYNWLLENDQIDNKELQKFLIKLLITNQEGYKNKETLLKNAFVNSFRKSHLFNNENLAKELDANNDNKGYSYWDLVHNKNNISAKIFNTSASNEKEFNTETLVKHFATWRNDFNPYHLDTVSSRDVFSWTLRTAITLGEQDKLNSKIKIYNDPNYSETKIKEYDQIKKIAYSSIISILSHPSFDALAQNNGVGLKMLRGSGTIISGDIKYDKTNDDYKESHIIYVTNGHVISGMNKSGRSNLIGSIAYISFSYNRNTYYLPFEIVDESYNTNKLSQKSEVHYLELIPRYDLSGTQDNKNVFTRNFYNNNRSKLLRETHRSFNLFFKNLDIKFKLNNSIGINGVNFKEASLNGINMYNVSANHDEFITAEIEEKETKTKLESSNEIVNLWNEGGEEWGSVLLNKVSNKDYLSKINYLNGVYKEYINKYKMADYIYKNKLKSLQTNIEIPLLEEMLSDYLSQLLIIIRFIEIKTNALKDKHDYIRSANIDIIPGSSGSGVYSENGLVGLVYAKSVLLSQGNKEFTEKDSLKFENFGSLGTLYSRNIRLYKGLWVTNLDTLTDKIFDFEYRSYFNDNYLERVIEGQAVEISYNDINWSKLSFIKRDERTNYLNFFKRIKNMSKEELLQIYVALENNPH